jgi:hypothetical protein
MQSSLWLIICRHRPRPAAGGAAPAPCSGWAGMRNRAAMPTRKVACDPGDSPFNTAASRRLRPSGSASPSTRFAAAWRPLRSSRRAPAAPRRYAVGRSPGRPDRRFGDGASYRAVANGAGMGVFSRLYLRVWRENNTAEDGIALATRRFGCPIVPVAPHP